MATLVCRVQFLDDTDPFNSTSFPEPSRPPQYSFREEIPLINQIAGVHRLLKAPHKLDDCALQLSHNGSYLDLDSTLAEQRDELEGFQVDGGAAECQDTLCRSRRRGKKHSIVLRMQLSVRVHACIGESAGSGTLSSSCPTTQTRQHTSLLSPSLASYYACGEIMADNEPRLRASW
ncbi:FH1/FH2 domain-containing protein 3-like isoform X1 [Gadus macrocephalus]|uniref:FH1/FH2 domain-containing protein 3-like isoform X1 n=1 Tax=Gadus macrocephalus TaxID=80720 RepID=UPI0028CB850F|nr:FH1/FH2 domain-containing protein 3-like isoform X1 [Gadus macrocephalus]